MRLLIEEYLYDAADVREVLSEIGGLENIDNKVSVNYVGYFYNRQLDDIVFILPKVLLSGRGGREYVFTSAPDIPEEQLIRPEDIIDVSSCKKLTAEQRSFIYHFSVWIYRAIVVFHNTSTTDHSIVYQKHIPQVGGGRKKLSNTYLDIVLSLIKFNNDKQDFLFYILRNIHSGFNKINWTRTVAHSAAVVSKKKPVYLQPVNKKRQVNFDEELFVIFFSILNYLKCQFGFNTAINVNFDLITGKRFEAYLKGLGTVRLRQIKYKYFSDKAVRLWWMCYDFFDQARKIVVNTGIQDYLLVKDFNIVFEAMIDELVGDSRDKIPEGLKDQDDGKRIDHLYSYQGLINQDEDKPVYYIGDSKYYKDGTPVGRNSVYKQFTYARNVIQWNLNVFMNEDENREELETAYRNYGKIGKLRDDETEGYNVIPNFFISATLDKNLRYDNDGITLSQKHHQVFPSEQFENRLFDRDTLLVCHYDVNFLFVLSLYARNNYADKQKWKGKIREMFRKQIQEELAKHYDFYAMEPHEGVDARKYLAGHFQELLGKVYRPFANGEVFSLALDNNKKFTDDNKRLVDKLRENFYVEKCGIGEDPEPVLEKAHGEHAVLIQPGDDSDEENILIVEATDRKAIRQLLGMGALSEFTITSPPDLDFYKIKYVMPVFNGGVSNYFEIGSTRLSMSDGNPAITFHLINRKGLDRFHPLKDEAVKAYNVLSLSEIVNLLG